jgi:hypothetical protein
MGDIRDVILNTIAYQLSSTGMPNPFNGRTGRLSKVMVYQKAKKILGISDKMKSDGKVIIYGDSHSWGLSAKLKNKLRDSFEVIGYTKPNCDIQTLLSIRNQDITKLSNKDVLVFIGGANDLTGENSSKVLCIISQFVRQNTQTNIILLTIP